MTPMSHHELSDSPFELTSTNFLEGIAARVRLQYVTKDHKFIGGTLAQGDDEIEETVALIKSDIILKKLVNSVVPSNGPHPHGHTHAGSQGFCYEGDDEIIAQFVANILN